MSGIVKAPGFDNSSGNRNRRLSRFSAQSVGAGNQADRRHKFNSGTTIGFNAAPSPDEITDSGNGLGQYEIDEQVDAQGSSNNDDTFTVQAVAAGALDVDETLTTEAAGGQVTLRSRNNLRDSRFV